MRDDAVAPFESAAPEAPSQAPSVEPAVEKKSAPSITIETPFKVDARPVPPDREAFLAELRDRTQWNQGGLGDLERDPPPVEGHPLPRVIIDILHATGQKSAKDVERTMRAKYWIRVVECYQLGAFKNQKLRGEVTVKFQVTPGGKPKPGKAVSEKLPDTDVVKCLADHVSALDFGRERGMTSVTAKIQIGAGDDPMPPPESEAKPGDGVLDPKAMRAPVEAALPAFSACYEPALAYAPSLWGRLAIRFHLTEKGKLDEAFEVESHFPDERVARCVLKAARALSFDKPSGGEIRFVVPLRFGRAP